MESLKGAVQALLSEVYLTLASMEGNNEIIRSAWTIVRKSSNQEYIVW